MRSFLLQVALAFVNDSCQSTHGNIRVDSIFTSSSGEWKLGGFEVLSNAKDEAAVLYVRNHSNHSLASPHHLGAFLDPRWPCS